MQPINLVTSTSVINNASCNWVNLVQVSSVQFGCCKRGLTGSTSCRSAQISVVQFVCCERAFSVPLCLSACVSVRRFILLPHSLSLSLKIPPPSLPLWDLITLYARPNRPHCPHWFMGLRLPLLPALISTTPWRSDFNDFWYVKSCENLA